MRGLGTVTLLLSVVVAACSTSSGRSPVADAHEEVRADTAIPDLAAELPYAEPEVAPEPDLTPPDVALDAETPTLFAAVPGVLCNPGERIGQVAISGEGSADSPLTASARVTTAVHPFMPGESALSEGNCDYYQQVFPGFCDPPCEGGTLCGDDDVCHPLPTAVKDLVLTVRAGDETQTVTHEGTMSDVIWATLELPGRTFSLELAWAGLTVTMEETTVPEFLEGVTGTLAGSYDAPEGLEVTWTVPDEPAYVTTDIPINHHAGGPSFTRCSIAASAGTLHVAGALLEPLAIITGLEFQGIEHTQYAAAQTPLGCIEIRYEVHQYVDLQY